MIIDADTHVQDLRNRGEVDGITGGNARTFSGIR
jgi:hypothetical protein